MCGASVMECGRRLPECGWAQFPRDWHVACLRRRVVGELHHGRLSRARGRFSLFPSLFYRYSFFPFFRSHVKFALTKKRALRRCIGGKCLGPVDGLKLRQTCAWPLVLKMPDFDFSQVVAFRENFLTFRMAPTARTDARLPNHYPPRARVHSLVHSLG